MDIKERIRQGIDEAFIGGYNSTNLAYTPEFVINNHTQGQKVLSVLDRELSDCDEFSISVAFITESGIVALLQTLKELERKNIKGRVLTTDYLCFSEPTALDRLASLKNITVKMYCSGEGVGFHTKGYIFQKEGVYRIIIGSSNMTQSALTVNQEWNTKIVSAAEGELAKRICNEFECLWADKKSLCYDDFINDYKDIHHNTDLLNMKADFNIMQMNQLQNMVSSLEAVTWLNCAFGILNCGISIVGFSQVLSKLNRISEQISALEQKIGWNLMNDYRQQFERFYDQIRTDIQFLQNPEVRISEIHAIPEHLNLIRPFLNRIYNEFLAGNIDNELACNIIFGLTNAFAQEVQFYSVRYLYEKGELPAVYDSWFKIVADICEKDFQSRLETALSLEHIDLPYKQQKEILDATVLSSRLQMDNLVFSNLLTDKIPEMDYLYFDDYLAKLSSSEENFVETEDGALLMIA